MILLFLFQMKQSFSDSFNYLCKHWKLIPQFYHMLLIIKVAHSCSATFCSIHTHVDSHIHRHLHTTHSRSSPLACHQNVLNGNFLTKITNINQLTCKQHTFYTQFLPYTWTPWCQHLLCPMSYVLCPMCLVSSVSCMLSQTLHMSSAPHLQNWKSKLVQSCCLLSLYGIWVSQGKARIHLKWDLLSDALALVK